MQFQKGIQESTIDMDKLDDLIKDKLEMPITRYEKI